MFILVLQIHVFTCSVFYTPSFYFRVYSLCTVVILVWLELTWRSGCLISMFETIFHCPLVVVEIICFRGTVRASYYPYLFMAYLMFKCCQTSTIARACNIK